jgi:hypothetical protein
MAATVPTLPPDGSADGAAVAAGRADDRDHPGATSPRAAAHGAWGRPLPEICPFQMRDHDR